MNESPWQPPADGQPEAEQPTLPPRPDSPAAHPGAPSPWSPEGAEAWTRPPDQAAPTWSAPGPADMPVPTPSERPASGETPPPPPMESPVAPTGDSTPPEPTRRRSKAVVGGAVVAVGALGLAGLFAVQRLSDGSSGGAATADQLGLDLLAAIESEDVLGVIDTMLPGDIN